MKTCQRCGLSHELNNFVVDKRRKDGLYPYCKDCSRDYYVSNRQRLLEQKKEYGRRPEVRERLKEICKTRYQDNKEFRIKQRQEYYSTSENRKKLMFFKARERAEQDGIEFSIEIEDIVIPTHCPYLEIELTHSLGKGQLETNSSLDRIDSTKGYIKGNVQVISRLANTMKNNASAEQLLTFSKNCVRLHS